MTEVTANIPLPAREFSRRWMLAAMLVLGVATWVSYLHALKVPFLFDDHSGVVNNTSIRQLHLLSEVLSPPNFATGAGSRPIVNLSLAVNYALGGLEPAGYHGFNLVVHALNGFLLFVLVRQLFASPALQVRTSGPVNGFALGIAVTWTVHPVQSESVVCVIQRSELIGAFFYLLTLVAFMGSTRSSRPMLWAVGSFVACLTGVFSKEFIVSAPLLVLCLDRTLVSGSFIAAWRRRGWLHAALFACWIPLTFLILNNENRGGGVGLGLGVSSWSYLLTQCEAIVKYLRLAFWPDPLVLDYGLTLITSLGEVWWQALLLVSLALATLVGQVRNASWSLAGLFFFAVLAPSSSVVPLITQTMAEHRLYLPLAAVIVLTGVGARSVLRKPVPAGATALVVCVAFVFMTRERVKDYESEISVWTDTVEKRPRNSRARDNLGQALGDAGRLDEAITCYRTAINLNPQDGAPWFNLGNALFRKKQPAAAIEAYTEAVRLVPGNASYHNNLGVALSAVGRTSKAIEHFQATINLRPDHGGAHLNLAIQFLNMGQWSHAIFHSGRASEINPGSAKAPLTLAESLRRAGRTREAVACLTEAAHRHPNSWDVLVDLARLLNAEGRFSDAVPFCRRAIAIQPDSTEARTLLDRALTAIGQKASNAAIQVH